MIDMTPKTYIIENKSLQELQEDLNIIPAIETELCLKNNNFNHATFIELNALLAKIPQGITKLYFINNKFLQLTFDRINNALFQLHARAISLCIVHASPIMTVLKYKETSLHIKNLNRISCVALEELLAKIPDRVDNLHLSNNHFDMSVEQLVDMLSKIPFNATLHLNTNFFNKKSVMQIQEFSKKTVPASISFNGIDLKFLNAPAIAKISLLLKEFVSRIPDEVFLLDLHDNDIGGMPDTEVCRMFAIITNSVLQLNLSMTNLGAFSGPQLEQIFGYLPNNLFLLDLSSNGLRKLSGTQLGKALSFIKSGITSLNLGTNGFDRLSPIGIGNLLNAVPKTIVNLKLNNNNLGFITPLELTIALAKLDGAVLFLDLSNNGLEELSVDALDQLIENLPVDLISLRLNYRNLGNMPFSKLSNVLAKIHYKVTLLDLSNNNFGAMSASDFAQVVVAIPKTVQKIYLMSNNLFRNKSPQEIDEYLVALGESRTRFGLTDNGESDLVRALAPLLSCLKQKQLGLDICAIILSYLNSDQNSPLDTDRGHEKRHAVYCKKLLEIQNKEALTKKSDSVLNQNSIFQSKADEIEKIESDFLNTSSYLF